MGKRSTVAQIQAKWVAHKRKRVRGKKICCFRCVTVICDDKCNNECDENKGCAIRCIHFRMEGRRWLPRIHLQWKDIEVFEGKAYPVWTLIRDKLKVPYYNEDQCLTDLRKRYPVKYLKGQMWVAITDKVRKKR